MKNQANQPANSGSKITVWLVFTFVVGIILGGTLYFLARNDYTHNIDNANVLTNSSANVNSIENENSSIVANLNHESNLNKAANTNPE